MLQLIFLTKEPNIALVAPNVENYTSECQEHFELIDENCTLRANLKYSSIRKGKKRQTAKEID